MTDDSQWHLIGEEAASPPRKRLAELLLWPWVRFENGPEEDKFDGEAADHEIGVLAREHPEVFAKDFHMQRQKAYSNNDRRSPLAFLMRLKDGLHKGNLLSIETFEAVYAASPDAIHGVDSFEGTLLLDLLSCYQRPYPDHDESIASEKHWFALLQSLVQKAPALLAPLAKSDRFWTPLTKAVQKGCSQHIIEYMIDKHPGDPFLEETICRRTLLSYVVGKGTYSFELVKHIFDKNPEAGSIQQTDICHYTPLHDACGCSHKNADVLTLLLTAHPELAFLSARGGQLPLRMLIGSCHVWIPKTQEERKCLEVVACANPNAIFTSMVHHNDFRYDSSPFSALSALVLDYEGRSIFNEPTEDDIRNAWSCLYFFMTTYRQSGGPLAGEAWQQPQYPVHMAASCLCPSYFLLHLARSNPDQLLQVDMEGRTVLALALESGHSMIQSRTIEHHDETLDHCIQQLVEIDIRSVGLRDPKTGLYPFMTAATMEMRIIKIGILDDGLIAEDSYVARRHEGEVYARAPLACLNTIYFLLSVDPSKALPL